MIRKEKKLLKGTTNKEKFIRKNAKKLEVIFISIVELEDEIAAAY